VTPPDSEAELVAQAVDGDQAAVYRVALRMVWRPADAEDATQEILIRVLTRLVSWKGEASLVTWAYRIAINYLLNLRHKTPLEQMAITFDKFGEDLADGLATRDYEGPDAELLAEEVRLRAVMSAKCGLVNQAAACRCSRRIEVTIAGGRIDRRHPVLATHPAATSGAVKDAARQMSDLFDAAAVLRSHPDYSAPRARSEAVLSLARSGRLPLLG
jgi:RNA polymerase sigma factor (sigma-70 family)